MPPWIRRDECDDVPAPKSDLSTSAVRNPRNAASRGFRTALVDKSDFGAGTSSHSSCLIHGGIRYLEQRAFHLVFEASRERRELFKIAPPFVRPRRVFFSVLFGGRLTPVEAVARKLLFPMFLGFSHL